MRSPCPNRGSTPTSGEAERRNHDPFDPARLRLNQDFASSGGVKRHRTHVQVRKPTYEEWVMVHPADEYMVETMVLEIKGSRETYLLDPELHEYLATEPTVSRRQLLTVVNRQRSVFVWPLKLPPLDGRREPWSETAMEIAHEAKTRWVRMRSDASSGCYVFDTPLAKLDDPIWPEEKFRDLLELAFKKTRIDSLNHPIVRQLRGEA
jgi:hypothetical protein